MYRIDTFYHNITNEYILSQIPREFLINVIDSVHSAYSTAHKISFQEFQRPLADTSYPIIRPAYIDQEINQIAQNYDEINASYNPNSVKNSFHTEVVSGDFIITFSKIDHKYEIVRKARYRETLAKDNQYEIFKNIDDDNDIVDGKIYALITHVPNPEKPEQPSSINFAIPNSACSKYIRNINLKKLTGYDQSSGGVSVEDDIEPIEPVIRPINKADSNKDD